MKNNIEAIIFDLGNVLLDFDHWIAAKKIAGFSGAGKSERQIHDLFFDSPLTSDFEQGSILPQDFFLKVKEQLDLKLSYEEFVPIWNDIFFLTSRNKGVFELIKKLKGRYRMALLSNINVLHFEYVFKKFRLFDDFNCLLTSYELGLRKPHPLIYQKALECLNVSSAERVFYADDRPDLIEKARDLNIRAYVFLNAEKLERDLSEAGVKIN